MPTPLEERRKRVELLHKILKVQKKLSLPETYTLGLSTWHGAVTRRKIDEYIQDLVYMGVAERQSDHILLIGRQDEEEEETQS